MAQIVINISNDTYYRCKNERVGLLPFDIPEVCDAIRNGIPLPKEHGRLIDEKVLLRKLRSRNFGFNLPTWIKVAIDNTPTIIEADKE